MKPLKPVELDQHTIDELSSLVLRDLSDLAILNIAHFCIGIFFADRQLRAAAMTELFHRGFIHNIDFFGEGRLDRELSEDEMQIASERFVCWDKDKPTVEDRYVRQLFGWDRWAERNDEKQKLRAAKAKNRKATAK